jgi:hypothetical protein
LVTLLRSREAEVFEKLNSSGARHPTNFVHGSPRRSPIVRAMLRQFARWLRLQTGRIIPMDFAAAVDRRSVSNTTLNRRLNIYKFAAIPKAKQTAPAASTCSADGNQRPLFRIRFAFPVPRSFV